MCDPEENEKKTIKINENGIDHSTQTTHTHTRTHNMCGLEKKTKILLSSNECNQFMIR